MIYFKSKKLTLKVLFGLLVIGVVVLGFIGTRHYLWWFSSGYTPRQTVSSFYNALTSGKNQQAYNLTTSEFQTKNSFVVFESIFDNLNGSKLKFNYIKYAKVNNISTVAGTYTNKSTGLITRFAISISRGSTSKVSGIVLYRDASG